MMLGLEYGLLVFMSTLCSFLFIFVCSSPIPYHLCVPLPMPLLADLAKRVSSSAVFFFSVSDVTVLRISLSELFLFFLYLSSLLQGKSHVTIKRSNEFVTFMSFYFSMHSCIQRFSLSN